MSSLVGSTLGKYQLLEEIGKGGMARVYKARQSSLNRFVAIKVLHTHLMAGHSVLERFQREARAAASLRHTNIVQVFDFDVQDNIYYMVMEFIDGMTLKDWLLRISQSGRVLTLNEAESTFNQVAAALDYAHSNGMLHRDIKPTNILIDQSGNAYLSDFGIARMVSEKQITITGALIGTPEYMSPEQALGQSLTPASDIYSLAVTFFETLTCKVPFSAPTPMSVMQMHISQPPPPLSIYRPDLPKAVEAVLFKAMEKNSRDRYQSVTEFHQAVQNASRQPEHVEKTIIEPFKAPIGATIIEPVPQSQPPVASAAPPTGAVQSPPQKKSPALLIAAISAVLLVVFLLVAGLSGWIRLPFFTADTNPKDVAPPIVVEASDTPAATDIVTEPPPETTQAVLVEATQEILPTPTPRPTSTPPPQATDTDVPTPTVEKPSLTADQNYFCRQRPDPTSDEHWIFQAGSTALLLGKSDDNWWLIAVDDPSTRTKCCWVGGGRTNGDSSIVPFISFEINRLDCPPAP